MSDFETVRAEAVRYWERKRWWYNAALVVPTLLGFALGSVSAALDDLPTKGSLAGIILALLLLVVAANVAFSLAYAFEFLWGCRWSQSSRLQLGRRIVFISGLMVASVLAFGGGFNLALLSVHGIRLW